eukprot:15365495-Ditylum_brightwellii.AAC.1
MESVLDYNDDDIELLSPYLKFIKSSTQSSFEEMSNLSTAEKENFKKLQESNKFLITDEEEHILNACTKLGNFGFPVTLKIVAKVLSPEVKGFSDVDPSNVYNIDEIGVDTTKKSRIKVLHMAEKQKTQVYHRMTRQMSIVSYNRADGAYCYPGDDKNNYDEYGAIPLYVIHANKSTVKKDDISKSAKYDDDEASANYVSGLYIYDEDNKNISNPFGLRCKTTPK